MMNRFINKHLGYNKGDFPVAEQLSNNVLSIPISIGMIQDEIDWIENRMLNSNKNG